MATIADQTTEQLGGRGSLLERQRQDHVALDELLTALAGTTGAAQDEVLQRIARLVFPHAYAEETVIWPVARAALPDGERITLEIEQEHQEINELFSDLDRTPAGPERAALVDRLVLLLQADVREEEDELLPRLQEALTASQLRRLGLTWELVRRVSPTRPHAVVSRRPPGNVLSALPLTVLDRSRDGLDRAARRAPAPLSGPSRIASRGLALVAGAVEHLPPLRWGERPSTRVNREVLS
jgi:hypothetical protein